jgi:hypothetical protein
MKLMKFIFLGGVLAVRPDDSIWKWLAGMAIDTLDTHYTEVEDIVLPEYKAPLINDKIEKDGSTASEHQALVSGSNNYGTFIPVVASGNILSS